MNICLLNIKMNNVYKKYPKVKDWIAKPFYEGRVNKLRRGGETEKVMPG